SKRLIQLCGHFRVTQFREKRSIDRLPLFHRQPFQRCFQQPALFLEESHLLRIRYVCRRRQSVRIRVDALFPLIESQPVDSPAASLIHDPSDDRSVCWIVSRGLPPNVVEHIDGHLFRRLPIRRDPHDQCKDNTVSLFVQRVQSALITGCDRLQERNPTLLAYATFGLRGIQYVFEGFRSCRFVVHELRCHYKNHGRPVFASSSPWRILARLKRRTTRRAATSGLAKVRTLPTPCLLRS